jgi:hypothetical protein
MVEVRIIPEGIRSERNGVFSKKPAPIVAPIQRAEENYVTASPRKHSRRTAISDTSRVNRVNYHSNAQGAVDRMNAENKKENARVRPRTIRRWALRELQAGNPSASLDELEKLVDQLMPALMAKYKGPQALKPEISEETKKVWAARKTERRRVVKANKLTRKMDQPLSSADRKWINKTAK